MPAGKRQSRWSLAPRGQEKATSEPLADAERLWSDLAAEDAAQAYRAVCRLHAAGPKALIAA